MLLFRKYLLRCVWLGIIFISLTLSDCVVDVSSKNTFPIRDLPPMNPVLKGFLDDYAQFFKDGMVATQTPGAAIVIVKGDSVIFQRGFGVREVGKSDSIDVHTVFRVGSLSKGFAGVLTGILVQNGLLDWDEKVKEGFPEFSLKDKKQADRIKLWHVLSHTTGLPYHAYTNLIEKGFDVRKIALQYIPGAPLSAKEGEVYSYQNAAFCIIEEVMRGKLHKSYQQLLQEDIFTPNGMSLASCDFESIQNIGNKALPHFWTGSFWRPDEISPLYYNAAAAGGVNASISDMGKWLKLLLGHRPAIANEVTLDRVFSPVVETGSERRIFRHWINRSDASYAMGWRVLNHHNDTIIYHAGYVNGFRSEIAFNRKDDIGICILFNGSSELAGECVPNFFDRWELVRDSIH